MEELQLNPLNSSWDLWFHKNNDTNWDLASYKKISSFSKMEELFYLNDMLKPIHVENGMFFLMRENIDPLWESKDNLSGGCLSFKIIKHEIYGLWKNLALILVNESILKDEKEFNNINGISISPKKTFSIIKIWFRNNENQTEDKFNNLDGMIFKEAIYKKYN